ncbi:hypothetical protein FDU21_14675 [Xanthomonas oryzae pv. oryzae]|nr:hypothetical protein FDU21_14675 [Xanthomonas oryzae pv. oryzae]
MSMSDRKSGSPVPALSDIGAYTESPGMPGLSVFIRCCCARAAAKEGAAADWQKTQKLRVGSPRLPTLTLPHRTRGWPLFQFQPLRPCRNATTGAGGISARNMPT